MHRTRTALAITTACLVTAGAAPAVASADDSVAVVNFTPQERADALAYWTPQRMKQVGQDNDLGPTGPISQPWQGKPLGTIGRLFFVHGDNGLDSYCTATSVRSGNHDVVLTAGHCVWKPGAPDLSYPTMVFVPGYDQGDRPFGVFPVRTVLTPKDLTTDSHHDVAAVVVDPVGGKHVNDVAGAQPVAFDRQPGPRVTTFGYPDTHPQLGEELLSCTGNSTVDQRSSTPGDPQQLVPCDLDGGSSGGPWLADFDAATGSGTVVSVNSSLDPDQPNTMGGPVLGPVAETVYRQASAN
ncbi:serine protease [Amycolatopsis sp. FDAARGOS 1241]|uniref:trypsin-like serine peptidase n=1 Tax=Amycolatopsis sp. FDAARGOS 1241 TaxID=2778070 RepID=UPI001950EAD8|nr:trypsin-like peptidase domain-containing protein [Amycolatopsis sp. FDAARGOS 1241]QRP42965.1 trypsin-like peptidase domain-containing protein [Amycolatopsis sp. FDAARGOS 1241]